MCVYICVYMCRLYCKYALRPMIENIDQLRDEMDILVDAWERNEGEDADVRYLMFDHCFIFMYELYMCMRERGMRGRTRM